MNYTIPLALVFTMFTASTVTAETAAPRANTAFELVEQTVACSSNPRQLHAWLPRGWQETLLFSSDATTYTSNTREQKLIPATGEFMFLVDQETGIFKAVMFYPDGTVCELIAGKNFEPYVGE
jgi:hypothetical protein